MKMAPMLTCSTKSIRSFSIGSSYKRPLIFLLVLFLAAGFVSGCTDTRLLNQFKKDLADKNYPAIADQAVDCDKASQTCAQLHLIKGDSCFRLAKRGPDAKPHYECASHEMALGITLNKKWTDDKDKLQYHENLCESLRNLQDLQSGDAANQTLEKLDFWSNRLHALAPESLAAVYFVSKTTLRHQEKKLFEINEETRGQVCMDLNTTHKRVKNVIQQQNSAPGRDWARYRDNYQTLSKNLKRAMQVAECR